MERVIFTKARRNVSHIKGLRTRYLAILAALICFALGVTASSRPSHSAKATVLLFLSTDCPISAKYTTRINALYDKFANKDVSFEALFPNDLETMPSVRAYMSERNYQFPYAIDLGAQRAKKLHVRIVPTAVILSADNRVAYEGAIDDNPDSTAVQHAYVADALNAELSGIAPLVKK